MFRSLCAVTLLAAAVHADVIVVDPVAGHGAALLEAKFAAAQPGDILLLREGDYSSPTPITLSGKGVALVADTGTVPRLPGLVIEDVPAGESLLLRGLRLEPATGTALRLEADGPVWIEGCTSIAAAAALDAFGSSGGQIGAPFAVIVASRFEGGRGGDAGTEGASTPGGAGLNCLADTHALFGVEARGGRGGDGPTDPILKANGGAGLTTLGGTLVLAGGSFAGGDEGLADPATTQGGPGLQLTFATLYHRGAAFVPGGVTGEGLPGVPINSLFATEVAWPAAPRLLDLTSPVREFGTARVQVTGVPGDLVLLQFALSTTGEIQDGKQGALVVPPDRVAILGAIGTGGELIASFTLPELPHGTDGATIFAQIVTQDLQGEVTLGGASALTWISAAF